MVRIQLTKPGTYGGSDIEKDEGLFIDVKFPKKKKKRGRRPKKGKALKSFFKPVKKRGKLRLTRGVRI